MAKLFELSAIDEALRGFLEAFPRINDTLLMRREDFSTIMIDNILEAYSFLNDLLSRGMDLFTPAGLHGLLEMNHLVLCGSDSNTRAQFYTHLQETRKSFLVKIKPIKDWVLQNLSSADAFKLAAGFYSQMLSQPQLFLEGNHRTGNIILNYLLISKGANPYVADAGSAAQYLDISGDIKFTSKISAIESTLKMPGHRKRFVRFLEEATDARFVRT